jgi:hypothetical protein
MVKLSLIKSDATAENNGVWVEWEYGVKLLIARSGNKNFDSFMQRVSPDVLEKMRNSDDPEHTEAMLKKAIAKTILLGWKNIDDDDGNPLKYSAKRALEFLEDDGFRDLYKFVLIQSNEQANYRRKVEDEGAKN